MLYRMSKKGWWVVVDKVLEVEDTKVTVVVTLVAGARITVLVLLKTSLVVVVVTSSMGADELAVVARSGATNVDGI